MKLFITVVITIVSLNIFGQTNQPKKTPINWQLLDWKDDGYPGISVEKAYNELLKNKTPQKKIIVAIIDDGMDFNHPDLKGLEWTNTKEIAGNGMDDDHNGFTDDIHGWNFIGNLQDEQFEAAREYVRLKNKFENKADSLKLRRDPEYKYWKKILAAKNELLSETESRLSMLKEGDMFLSQTQQALLYWQKRLKTDTIYYSEIINLKLENDADSSLIKYHNSLVQEVKKNQDFNKRSLNHTFQRVKDWMDKYRDKYYADNKNIKDFIALNEPAYNRKKYLGDDPYSNNQRNYGDNNTLPLNPDYSHAMHIAGIIGGCRNNEKGGNGITNSVAFMSISIYHGGDEWDKDVANAIIYAADNGAQLINMSFSKNLSPQKKWVDEAVTYAEKKGVLLFDAPGNDQNNNDSNYTYPNASFLNGKKAGNLLLIGASTFDSSLIATFSNYGKKTVDVFAPGVDLYSDGVKDTFAFGSGTSFSTPMVTGLAALIWSYYPTFTYKQVRYCIEASATPIDIIVTRPGTNEKIPFKELSRTGGIINAFRAVEIAEKISKIK